MINNDHIRNPAYYGTQDSAETAHTEEWETFKSRPLPQQVGIIAKRLLELATVRTKDYLASMSTRKKLAIVALPAAAGFTLWGNTPHEVASDTAYIQAGDGGVRTTCAATEQLALQNGLDPERGDNCVYAGQRAGQELRESHPGRDIQPGEPIIVTLLQSPFNQFTESFTVNAHKASE